MDYFLGKYLYQLNQQEAVVADDALAFSKVIRKKKMWLWISIVVNIGFLGFFKYFNFFADLFALFNLHLSRTTLNIVLPVGISFYTFQTLSYTIDMYFKKTKPATDWVQFFAFVSFFPQLVAGSIEPGLRNRNFLG